MKLARGNRASLAALAAGLGASLVAAAGAVRRIGPLLLSDQDPAWALPRLVLTVGVIGVAAAAGILAATAMLLWSRSRAAQLPLEPLPWRGSALAAVAMTAVAAAAAARFTRLSDVPLALWIEDLTLIDPSLALTGTWRDFADAIRPAPFGVARPYGSVGVLYLEAFRACLHAFGTTAFGVRFLSALAGTVSCVTAVLLGRALLPRGGGSLAGLALAGLRWSLILSRWGYVAIVLIPLADAAALALLHAKRRRSAAAALAAGAILGVGAHVYLAAWIVLVALVLFALWPVEGGAPVSRRVFLTVALVCGFAAVAAPLFLLREGRRAPYFARARNQSMLRVLRSARSPLPLLASAADAVAAPWWLPDPSPWQDVPKPRLGWLIGIPVAVALGRSLLSPGTEISAFLLAHAGAASAAFVASGPVMQPNGFRFAYLTTVTAIAAAAGLLALAGAAPRKARRSAALLAVGVLLVSGALSLRAVFFDWAPRLEVLDGFEGHDNLLARVALQWECYGRVEIDPALVLWPAGLEAIRRVRRTDLPPGPATPPGRTFRIVPSATLPSAGERAVSRIADEHGAPLALVLARRS
ncbi:MAG: glycosyltransferase family 39 protein [Acidobacteriota bacterium]